MSKQDKKALAKQESHGGGPLTLRNAMSRLFDESVLDPFGFFSNDPFFSSDSSLVNRSAPSMDMSESDDELDIKLDVPGYEPEDIKVDVEGNNLIISGESTHEEEVDEKKYYRKERATGSFSRCIQLPSYVDADNIDCSIKNGTLNVKIPKKKGSGKKSIDIKVK